jgi:hypothetical protein
VKLSPIIREILAEAEEDQLSAAMAQSFQSLGAELEKAEPEIQRDVENATIDEALGAVGIIGIILAAPKVVELLAKGMRALITTYKKLFGKKQADTEEEQKDVAEKIINFTHKWHKAYIKGLNWILKVSGIYKKAQITDSGQQMKAATMLYYTIVAGLAVYSGIGAIGAFKTAASTANLGDFSLGALETAMASIKSGEVAQFLTRLGLK